MVYCLHKMGFNGGEAELPAASFDAREGLALLPPQGVPGASLRVMRYFCGDITHVQAFVDRPASASARAT